MKPNLESTYLRDCYMLNMFYIHAGPSMMWAGSMRVNYLADSSRAATGGQTGKTAVLPAKNRPWRP